MSPGRVLAGALALAVLGGVFAAPGALPGPSFLVHAGQVVLLAFVAAPLLLLALPPDPVVAWFARPDRPGRALLARRLGMPAVAGSVFVAHLAFWHLPAIHTWMLAHPPAHDVALAGFLATGLLAWWCVCAPSPAAGRVGEPVAMLYLFVLGVPVQGIAALLATGSTLLDRAGGTGARPFGLTLLADQQAGGLVLWVPGGLILWIAISVLWVRWTHRGERSERAATGDDAPPPLTLPPR